MEPRLKVLHTSADGAKDGVEWCVLMQLPCPSSGRKFQCFLITFDKVKKVIPSEINKPAESLQPGCASEIIEFRNSPARTGWEKFKQCNSV